MLWLLGQGQTAQQVAAVTGYAAYWVGQIAKRYHEQGATGVRNRWHEAAGHAPAIPAEVQAELQQALAGPEPGSDTWTG